jgi:hypothetical protein
MVGFLNILDKLNEPPLLDGEISLFVQNANARIPNRDVQPIPGNVVRKHDAGPLGTKYKGDLAFANI